MAVEQEFVCPICGRKVASMPRTIASDSRSREEAADGIPDAEIAAPPSCNRGHPPTPMVPL